MPKHEMEVSTYSSSLASTLTALFAVLEKEITMKYGYFDNDNREYVITRPDVPAPGTNYLGTEKFCSVISHNAGGYSFYHSPEYNRVTKFRPNFTQDRPGHYVYLRRRRNW